MEFTLFDKCANEQFKIGIGMVFDAISHCLTVVPRLIYKCFRLENGITRLGEDDVLPNAKFREMNVADVIE